jgi:hypothetical protein
MALKGFTRRYPNLAASLGAILALLVSVACVLGAYALFGQAMK